MRKGYFYRRLKVHVPFNCFAFCCTLNLVPYWVMKALPLPASARIHLIASHDTQRQHKWLGFWRTTAPAGARLAAVWTGTVVTLFWFWPAGTTTSPLLLCRFNCGRSYAVVLSRITLHLLVYPEYKPRQLLNVTLLLQVWQDHRPSQVDVQCELPGRNIRISLQEWA